MLDTGQLPLSKDALRWFRQGLASAAAEAYEQAVSYYNKVIAIRSDFYEAWYERGLALERRGQYIEAIASFECALSRCSKSDVAREIWYALGNALQYGLGEYSTAIESYDRVLRITADHESAWLHRGNALLYGLDHSEEALTCYDRVLSINPNNHIAWRNRGNALVALKRYLEAIASYDKTLRLQADDESARNARNLAIERLGLGVKPPTRSGEDSCLAAVTVIEDEDISGFSQFLWVDGQDAIADCHPMLVIEDTFGKREILLDKDQYSIGRDTRNDLQLNSQFTSRHHAVFKKVHKDDGSYGYQIVDGGLDGKPSTNGLSVNGRKCRIHELQPGDVVVFGPQAKATFQVLPISSLQNGLN